MLSQLHGIHDVDTYLHKMKFSASNSNFESERGLWGDTFCIRWLSKWLNIPIGVWPLTRKTKYLFFNHHLDTIPLNILFHDTNPVTGNFEPLLHKILPRCNSVQNYYLSPLCKNLENHYESIFHEMKIHGFHIAKKTMSKCPNSMFSAIFHLIAPEFDEKSLRLYVVQYFCNALMGRDENALHFLEKHLTSETIQSQTMVAGWQQYLINMAMPYEKGAIQGTSFCFQWTSIIFNVNIQIWSFTNKTIVNYTHRKQIATEHITYYPLKQVHHTFIMNHYY